MIMKLNLLIATIVCLVAKCALAQYQTAPAYSNNYQNQRKMMMMGGRSQGYNKGGQQQQQQQEQQPQQQQQRQYGSAMGDWMQKMMSAKMGGPASKRSMYQKPQSSSSSSYMSNAGMGNAGMSNAKYGLPQAPRRSGYESSAKYEEPQHPPMPFEWGYDINDGYGTSQYHKENGDEQGKRTGSYGYMDAYGVMRHVYYVADENGFRATIKTNEPGTANENPADVEIQAEEPPAKVSEGNKNSGGSYGGGGGGGGGSYNSEGSNASRYGSQSGSSSKGAARKQYRSQSSDEDGKQYGSSSRMPDTESQFDEPPPTSNGYEQSSGSGGYSTTAAASTNKQRGVNPMMMPSFGRSSGRPHRLISMMMPDAANSGWAK